MTIAVTAADFHQWLEYGLPGSRISYFRGNLAVEREGMVNLAHDPEHTPHMHHRYFEPQHTLANEVYRASEAKRVLLFQRRHGVEDFEYIAQKRPGKRLHVNRRQFA